MISESVLYEHGDISRNDLSSVYGTTENINTFLNIYNERKLNGKILTVYGAKRVCRRIIKDIIVYGSNPIIRPLTSAEKESIKTYIPFAAVLVQHWGYGFYHFVNEMLPKILRIYEYNSKIPILIFYNNTFIKNILNHIGITNPIIDYTSAPYHAIKNAIHVTETASGNPSPNDIEIIRKHLRLNHTHLRNMNIIIYRKEKLRSIVNFNELKDSLMTRFPNENWVVFDSLPFKDAIELFQRAKIIIGAHGAGLSNMIMSPIGTPVIELFPATLFNMCYWHLSWILSNPHSILTSNTTATYNITVDIEKLIEVVAKYI